MDIYDMLVIGGGPGGYTAALYAAQAGLRVALLERLGPGGQMALTQQVDNYPGFPHGVDGFYLAQQMQQQAERFGVKTVYAEVTRLDLGEDPKQVYTTQEILQGRTVVIATGASPRELGLPGEQDLIGKGVSYCATCDGGFYKGKIVAVVGGGNSAAWEALHLSRIAKTVFLICRKDHLRADQLSQQRLLEAENITLVKNTRVTRLIAQERLSAILLEDVSAGTQTRLELDGLFISIGRQPATDLAQGQLELDEGGYILAGEDTRTSRKGVYAVGDVRGKPLRQIVTATADGAVAAYMAQKELEQ